MSNIMEIILKFKHYKNFHSIYIRGNKRNNFGEACNKKLLGLNFFDSLVLLSFEFFFPFSFPFTSPQTLKIQMEPKGKKSCKHSSSVPPLIIYIAWRQR